MIIKNINFTEIVAKDEKEFNANHLYHIQNSGVVNSEIRFQKGSIKEHGVNGCQNEDLIEICIHRLQCFQTSEFICRENALALTKLQEALHWLNHRTAEREKRGVEGRYNIK